MRLGDIHIGQRVYIRGQSGVWRVRDIGLLLIRVWREKGGEAMDVEPGKLTAGPPVPQTPNQDPPGFDPGVCGCPACHELYWAWGNRQRCAKCGFEYPVNAWPMYAKGVQARRRDRANTDRGRYGHDQDMADPYYRYGYEHPIETDLYEEFHKIDWRKVLEGAAK